MISLTFPGLERDNLGGPIGPGGDGYRPLKDPGKGDLVQDFVGFSFGNHLAAIQKDDPVGEPGGQVEVVGYYETCESTVGQLPDQFQQLHFMAHIQRSRWLVQDQGPGLLGQCARNPHPFPLATRQRVDRPLSKGEYIAALQCRLDRCPVRRAG
jgi:hypothetical protein